MSEAEIGKLIARLDSDEPKLRDRARHALVAAGTEAVPQLIDALNYERKPGSEPRGLRRLYREWREEVTAPANVPAEAALALGDIRDPRAVGPLTSKLRELRAAEVSDRSEGARAGAWTAAACVTALRWIGDQSALPVLVEVLDSEDEYDLGRIDAAAAIGEMRASGAIPVLLDRLARDPSALVRARVAEALGELADDEVVPQLLRALHDESEIVKNAATKSLACLSKGAPT